MQSALKKDPDAHVSEVLKFNSRDALAEHIKGLISPYADKPYSLSIEITPRPLEKTKPQNRPQEEMLQDTLSIFGYKNVTDIQTSRFFVHRKGSEHEAGFIFSFEADICRKSGLPTTDTNLIKALTDPGRKKKLSDEKFSGAVAAFSTLADAGVKSTQSKKLSCDTTNLELSKDEYKERFRVAVKFAELTETGGRSKEDAIRQILGMTDDTMHAVKACEDYYSDLESHIAYGWQKREYLAKNKLNQLIDNLKRSEDTRKVLNESKEAITSIGVDLFGIRVEREIREYEKLVINERRKVNSAIDTSSWEEGPQKEQADAWAEDDRKSLERDTKILSKLADTLKILQQTEGLQ